MGRLILLPAIIAWTIFLSPSAFAAEPIVIEGGRQSLRGVLYRPPGDGPFPAVVAMHGCGGLTTKSGSITARFHDWGARLQAAGFAVLFPDSFGSRGLGSQCTNKQRTVRASRERVDDANAARRWLQAQPWVRPDRVSVIGWSNGATTTLYTVGQKTARPAVGADFQSAIALYPGCRTLQAARWIPRLPTLILSGLADDWTPAAPCQRMAAAAQGVGAPVEILTYPGAYHDFDVPDTPVHERKGLAFSGDGSGTAHLGTNEAARTDVIRRVPQWLAR